MAGETDEGGVSGCGVDAIDGSVKVGAEELAVGGEGGVFRYG